MSYNTPEPLALKQSLLSQQRLRSLERQQAALDKLAERRNLQQDAKAAKEEEEQLKLQKQTVKRNLAIEYEAQQARRQQQTLNERLNERQEAQAQLAKLQQVEAREAQQRREHKLKVVNEQRAFLFSSQQALQLRKREDFLEKVRERDGARLIPRRTDLSVSSGTLKRQFDFDRWIHQYNSEQRQGFAQQAAIQRQWKEQAQRELRNGLEAQLHEQNLKAQQERLSRVREQETVTRAVELNKQLNRDQLAQRKQQQLVYRDQLLNQLSGRMQSERAASLPRMRPLRNTFK